MKILHGLVGYFAFTALPFHPFAFATPLGAIDHDGYVDTTQNHVGGAPMKQVIGNILETCQTVTSHSLSGYANATQHHSDSDAALMKRASSDVIEARFGPEIVPPVLTVIAIVAAITLSIVWVEGDDPVRGNYVELLVEHSDQRTSSRNVSRSPKIPSARCYQTIHNTTGLFATPHIPPLLMESRALTTATLITN